MCVFVGHFSESLYASVLYIYMRKIYHYHIISWFIIYQVYNIFVWHITIVYRKKKNNTHVINIILLLLIQYISQRQRANMLI